MIIGTITVNPSIDQHILIDQLVKDDAIRAKQTWQDPGGKGINVSRVIKELGGETVAFEVAGGCAGYMLKSLMAEQGIPFEAIEIPQETRINVIVTDRSDRTQTRISAPGPRMSLTETERFISRIVQHRPFPKWWVLGGSLPPGVPNDYYTRLITALQQRGAKCLLDTDDEALKMGLQSNPFMIKPNAFEFSRLVGRSLTDETSLLQAAQEVVEGGVQIVAVTLGRDGALVVTSEGAFRAFTPQVEVKSKVGAGDAFLAGCVLCFARGEPIEDIIRLGMAASTAAVMTEGTQLCRREGVKRLVEQIKIEPVAVTRQPSKAQPQRVRDVVCGMNVDPSLVSFSATHQDQTYRFCSLRCQKQFEMTPQRFIRAEDPQRYLGETHPTQ